MSYNGAPTGALFGFTNILASYIKSLDATRVYVVWDGERSKLRKKIYPDYKASRRENPDKEIFFKQKEVLMKLLDSLGVRQVVSNLEADDSIYSMVKRKRKAYSRIIICSQDKDFLQLIDDKVNVYAFNTAQADYVLIDEDNMKVNSKFPTPEILLLSLLVGGDKSDNIKGIRGYGEGSKSLENLVMTHKNLNSLLSNQDYYKGYILDDAKNLILRNRALVDLAYYHEHFVRHTRIKMYNKSPGLNTHKLEKIAKKNGLKYLLSHLEPYIRLK